MTNDDEDDDLRCYRHPARETALRCNECERPICVDCAVQSAVGFKCPECARTSRAARGQVPVRRMARGVVPAAAVAVVLGSLLASIRVPFIGWLLAYGVGVATGEVARRFSGGYRDPLLARIAATVAGLGVGVPPLLAYLGGILSPTGLGFLLLGAAFAAFGAYSRAS